MPLIIMEQVPQMPSRQSESKAMGSSPFGDQLLVDNVEHFQKGHVGQDIGAS